MAKSPIADAKKTITPTPPSSNGKSVEQIDMLVVIKNVVGTKKATTTFNLKELCYQQCNPSEKLATPCRRKMVKKFHKEITQGMKDGVSHTTLRGRIEIFRRYLINSDIDQVNPFSEEGYKAMHRKSWRSVNAAIEAKKYVFQYEDGEELGSKENSARATKVKLDAILNSIGFNVDGYQSSLKQFRKGKLGTTQPYVSDEWQKMLRRLNYYFTNLATELIAYRDENPTLPPPDILKGIVIDVIDGKEITIDVSTRGCRDDLATNAPFNQAMVAGYLLFSYYTAFNTTSILDVRHPISILEEERTGRTSRTVQVKSYKGRSSSEVKALFESIDESLHECANDDSDKAGVIIADVDKRDTNGIEDGVTFIEVLSTLSEAYSDKMFGRLFYFYQADKIERFEEQAIPSVSFNLGLYSSSRYELADYFIELFDNLRDRNFYPEFTVTKSHDGPRIVKKAILEPKNKLSRTLRLRSMLFGAMSCLTDIELKGIIMPLKYGQPNDDGNIKVSFGYDDGRSGEFIVSSKYKGFLEKLEAYSENMNPTPKKPTNGKGSCSKKPPYLLQVGFRYNTKLWNTPRDMLSRGFLTDYGLSYNEFYLSPLSGRIRVTTSLQEYSEEDNGFSAREILQHSLATQLTKYLNGHPVENKRMMSQGLNCLVRIAAGQSRNDAVEALKKELDIPVLAYDEYKARNMPTNPNGVLCDGVARITSNDGTHYGAKKFANKEIEGADVGEIPCYQYDMCIKCKSAELVDDVHAIYKLLSFIDALEDAIHLYPERSSAIEARIESFYRKLDTLPESTREKAEDMLDDNGRYFMFEEPGSVFQYT